MKRGKVRFETVHATFRSRQISEALAFGFREQATDTYEQVRVFSRERVLLMALESPHTHGGPRGVVAAWQVAFEHLREAQLIAFIRKLGRSSFARRAGTLAEAQGHAELSDKLEALITELDPTRADMEVAIPLLAGIDGGRELPRFRVHVPW